MNVRLTHARMEPIAQTVSTAIHAPAHWALVVSTVRSTPMTALTGSLPCHYLAHLLNDLQKCEQ